MLSLKLKITSLTKKERVNWNKVNNWNKKNFQQIFQFSLVYVKILKLLKRKITQQKLIKKHIKKRQKHKRTKTKMEKYKNN